MENMMKMGLSFLPDGPDHRLAGHIAVDVTANYYDVIKEVPGYGWAARARMCTVPKSWPAALALGAIAAKYGFTLSPDEEVLAWYKRNQAEWKTMREAAAILSGKLVKEEGFSYYPHQITGADWLLLSTETTGRALLDQTGAGKTGTLIRAIQKGNLTEKGPVLVICPESVMGTGWDQGMEKFAPELRTVQITGTATQRRKKMEAIRDGEFDVAIIGYSNLRTSTRLEAMPGHALRKCVACGGPRLTMGNVDENGKPLPDIHYHDDIRIRAEGGGFRAHCFFPDCGFASTIKKFPLLLLPEIGEHSLLFKKISELTIAQCQTHMKELNEIGWSVIIADEAHRVLNHQSQTAQALNGVAHYSPSDPLRWAATGTPISTKVEQVWSILHFLDPVAWPSRTKWVEWHCVKGYNNYGFLEWQGLKEKRQVEFDSTWSAVTRRVLKEQVLDLPPQLRWGSLEERLTMPRNSEQYRVYHEMKAEMLAMVDEGEITAQNALVQAGRLSMLASGTGFPIGQDGELGLKMPSVKVDALIQMWEDGEWEGEQLAVLFNSLKALRMTEDALYGAKLIRPETVSVVAGDVSQARRSEDINDFQSGKRKTVLLTYGAGGTGITLTAASTVVVFERAWSPILNAQGIDRFHRIGSERHKAITYRDLVVAGTIEVKQLDRMAQNDERLESIVHDRAKLRDLFGG
jgi:superfamily II DNA or RNA helicase